MTEEEKAKEYAISRTYPRFENDFIANFVLREVEGAYFAGLHEGQPKWHKVADGDLPKEEGDYLLCFYDKETKSTFYDVFGLAKKYTDKEDWYVESMIWSIEDVIAWCEIPQFKE